VDTIILVDDHSKDDTAAVAKTCPESRSTCIPRTGATAATSKTCYRLALEESGHRHHDPPDYQ